MSFEEAKQYFLEGESISFEEILVCIFLKTDFTKTSLKVH